jgi:hypothetical protein
LTVVSVNPEGAAAMTRDEAMLNDHLAGASLRELGQRYSLSHEGVRLAIARQGRQVIDRIHLDLLTSHATGEMPTFVVPGHAGPDFDLALEYVRWVTQELEGAWPPSPGCRRRSASRTGYGDRPSG